MKSKLVKSGKAVAYIEAILTLPVLLLILALTVETSNYIRYNIQASQLSYEGARIAASLSGLPDASQPNKVSAGAEGTIREKLLRIVERQKMRTPSSILFEYINSTPSNTVRVEVNIPYQPVLNIWGKSEIRSRATVPYLYSET